MAQTNRRVDFLGPEAFDSIYEPAMSALKKEGCDVGRFTDGTAYLESGRLASVEVIVDVDVLLVGAREMDAAPRLRALVSPVVGVEEFDHDAASERLILIANGQTVENFSSMAEAGVMLVLVSLYDFLNTVRYIDDSVERPDYPRARMLRNKKVGILGMGQIGQAIAERLVPFGCSIQATIQTPRPLPNGISAVPIEDLLRTSDVVIVAAEINEKTRHMLSAERLSLMKPDVIFINIARGGLSSDLALAKLAAERPNMKLALDVFDPEPLNPDSPLRHLTNAILTPHMVGHTVETFDRMPLALLESIERVLAGELPQFVRNRAIGDQWRKKWGVAARDQ